MRIDGNRRKLLPVRPFHLVESFYVWKISAGHEKAGHDTMLTCELRCKDPHVTKIVADGC